MLEIFRAARFRLYPNAKQKALLHEITGASRFIYNHLLADINDYKFGTYSKDETTPNIPSKFDLIKRITTLKKGYPFLAKYPTVYLRGATTNLSRAFDNFYRSGGYPKFKSRKEPVQSFSIYDGTQVKIQDNYIIINKARMSSYYKEDHKIKFKKHKIKWKIDKITGFTITKDAVGDYWLSLMFKTEIKKVKRNKIANPVGIDLGIKELLITSNGHMVKNNRFLKNSKKKLKRLQQSLSRKSKGSKNKEKARIKVAKQHRKIKRQRDYKNHNVTRQLVNIYDFIVTESLQVKNMIKNHNLAQAISDVAWGDLVSKLEYKANENQISLVKIDKFFPSSKTCSNCGNVKNNLKLSDRTYICSTCGFTLDRDVNAAINILEEGLRIYGFCKKEIKELVRNTHELSKIKFVETAVTKSMKQKES